MDNKEVEYRETKIHKLKTLINYFTLSKHGKKPYEIRKNDRDFQQYDKIVLQEYDGDNDTFTGTEIHATISLVLNGLEGFGLASDYCILSLSNMTLVDPIVEGY